MPRIRKLTIGIRPARNWFLLQDRMGELVDRIIGDPTGQHVLNVTQDNFALAFDAYDQTHGLEFSDVYEPFTYIWDLTQKVLNSGPVRRIGIVAEYRQELDELAPSAHLLDHL